MKKKILIGIASVTVIAVVLGLTVVLDGPVNLRNKKVDIAINSEMLYSEYELNEAESDIKYLNKVIEVEGNIAEISKDASGNVNIYLVTGDDAFGQVSCSIDHEYAEKAMKYKKGSIIKIKGQCSGYLMDVIMKNCIIII